MMDDFTAYNKTCPKTDHTDPTRGQTQTYVQLVLSSALGVSAFLAFCILRPKWKSLYAARKKQSGAAVVLPELPDTMFGWMPVLWRVTEEQVLASAGLDAFVFLSFFKMSMKLFGVIFLLALAILLPINKRFDHIPWLWDPPNNETLGNPFLMMTSPELEDVWTARLDITSLPKLKTGNISYLWAYLVFTYLFTGIALYFMVQETRKIIDVRQDYLGSQSTITDRTIKLAGIPEDLRSEAKIAAFIEKLEIGKVENVTLCKDWTALDDLMDQRNSTLRKLEEAWAKHIGKRRARRNIQSLPIIEPVESGVEGNIEEQEDHGNDGEDAMLLGSHITPYEKPRPKTHIWRGFRLQTVDSIDYFTEQLRKLDDKIMMARRRPYKATSLAFVTMDSTASSQMAVQTVLDPSPMRFVANLAPAPSDIIWRNTYMTRPKRMFRTWTITIFILVLSVVWLIPVATLAGLLDICSIQQVWPGLADLLRRHEIVKALVQTGLPTLVVSLLNIAVPFLYDYLANKQGFISQGQVELSVISKNFLFTFFNVFLVFTVFGAASKFWTVFQESLRDTTKVAYRLAEAIQSLAVFYTNFILLQGVGLMPFRLLEFGSVSLYPFALMFSSTPRDYAELRQPPLFKYGFYLPTAILIYILCIVYSVLPAGYMVLFFGLIYFAFGYYTYKYQLLYAMDHPQHSTGRAWTMICYRLLVGLGVFQVAMAGVIALKTAFTAAVLIIPLMGFTFWFSYYFARTFEPLTKYIALRSIRRNSVSALNHPEDAAVIRPPGYVRRQSLTLDESREKGLKFINPSLVAPLEEPWTKDRPEVRVEIESTPSATTPSQEQGDRVESSTSSISLGDTHIWRDNGENNV
ncbi:hypothetical protein F5884DRAFT_723472 [Xylogone sp. PMI_703]|nr:hypothetical protein F5884DRAFT_723472 [Xylogone sp. PMI_703]